MASYLDFEAYYNGSWIPYSKIMISPDDRGFMLSDAVFDVGRIFNGVPFRWEDHVDRLFRSLKYIDLDPGLSQDQIVELGYEAVERNRTHLGEVPDFIISCFVTRGLGVESIRDAGPHNICVNVKPISCATFARFFEHGAHGMLRASLIRGLMIITNTDRDTPAPATGTAQSTESRVRGGTKFPPGGCCCGTKLAARRL